VRVANGSAVLNSVTAARPEVRTSGALSELDVERSVRDRLYGGRSDVLAVPMTGAAQQTVSVRQARAVKPAAPTRVVVVGGGVAGLEALMALRALAGRHVELTLVAPGEEFVYSPLAVDGPFDVGRTRRVRLDTVARNARAVHIPSTIESVDPEHRTVSPSGSGPVGYDALVLAAGAIAVPAVAHAMTWDDRLDGETVGGLAQDFEHGYARRLAVVIPPGPVWPLRAYEPGDFACSRPPATPSPELNESLPHREKKG